MSAFLALANQFYEEHGSVKADPRLETANVWYWEEGSLTPIDVPTEVYGPVMAMRCCEEALKIEPNSREAIALWLAANIRREARLGMDVESAEPDEAAAEADRTRDAKFPRSVYFSRAAGAEYCHLVLGRAIADGDTEVALGAVAALDVVAGESSLTGMEDYKQPLVRALLFTDPEVRIKAAIALARALPQTPFVGADKVAPVLASALGELDQPQYVVVDADAENLNRVAEDLRASGALVVAESNFFAAMDRARRELPNLAAFFLATDIDSPTVSSAVAHLRGQYVYAGTPVVFMVKPKQEFRAEQIETVDAAAGHADASAPGDELLEALDAVAEKVGGGPLDVELASQLAVRTTEVLRLVAVDGRTVIELAPVVPALISALNAEDEELRIKAAQVLALVRTAEAQQAIAELALNEENSEAVRLAAFDTLAESAKKNPNRLTQQQVERVVKTSLEEPDLVLRTAASQALGALNLKVNEASAIIRSYHRG